MRPSKLLARLRAGHFCRVCSLGHFLPFYVRHAAFHRYDAIWIDLEHHTLSDRELQGLLALCHAHNIDAMVRPPTRERGNLYRYLEEGAAGLLLPMVADAADAQAVVEAAKFPPMGRRGLAGGTMDADYALALRDPAQRYTDDANRETFLIAQIETPGALASADAIAAVAGIDGLFVGPADLGLRLALDPAAPPLEEAVALVAAAAQRHGKGWGITAGTIADVARRRAQGAQIVPHGGDYALMQLLETWAAELDTI